MPRNPRIVADPPVQPALTSLQEAPAASSSLHRPRRRAGLAAAVALALATGGLALGVAAPASAAGPVTGDSTAVSPRAGQNMPSAVTDIVVSPTTPEQGAQVKTTLDFTVPAGTVAGDSFTVQLSPRLKDLPQTFPVIDTASDEVVANAVVVTTPASGTTPASYRLVVTFTDFVETHSNVSGSAYIESSFDSATTPSGVTTPFTSQVLDGEAFTTDITPRGPVGSHLNASKYGVFTRSDQGRVNPQRALEYRIDTPVGPFATATTTDTRPAGQTWTFACDALSFQDRQADAAGLYVPNTSKALTLPAGSVTCAPDKVTVTWPVAASSHFYRLIAPVDLAAATGTGAAQSFSNSAVTVLTRTAGGAPLTYPAQSVTRQASAGGEADGTEVTPPVTTPPVTTPPETTPPVETPPETTPPVTTPPVETPPETTPPVTTPPVTTPPTLPADNPPVVTPPETTPPVTTPPVTTPPVTTVPADTTPVTVPAGTTPVTTTPSATTPAGTTVAPTTQASAAPAAARQGDRSDDDSSLAFTGDEPLAPALIALLFALVGTGLVVAAHRQARRR